MRNDKQIKKFLVKDAVRLLVSRLKDFKLAGKVVVKIDNHTASKNVKQSSNA